MPKILYVEDDPFISEIYKKKFESSGFEVIHVTTGKAILKAALEQQFDAILLDLVIPEMSGTEVLRELRHNPGYSPDLKVIVFSNLSSTEDRDECLKLGANGFISKTEFSPSQVVDEVNRFLNQFSEQKKNFSRQETAPSDQVNLGKRILFIEDEETLTDMFTKRLLDEGYEVVAETDGIAGLKRATDEHFDMIVSDVMVPGLEGPELVQKLKEIEGKATIPIFFLSASLEDQHLKELTDSGLGDRSFLKTEITPSELTNAVNDFFGQK